MTDKKPNNKINAIILTIMLLITTLASACGEGAGTQGLKYPSKLESGEVLIPTGDFHITFYESMSPGRFFAFNIVTAEPLDMEGASASIDIETPYKFFISAEGGEDEGSEKVEEFPYYVFQNYQEVDWKEMYRLFEMDQELYQKENKIYQPYHDYRDEYTEAYQAMSAMETPEIYCYKATVNFDMSSGLDKNETINEITLTLNGREYVVDVGEIKLNYTTPTELNGSESVSMDSLAAFDMNLNPNDKGKIKINHAFGFTFDEETVIKGFDIIGGGAEVEWASLQIENGGSVMDIEWTAGKEITIPKGSSVSANLVIKDPVMIGKIWYSTAYHIKMNYEVGGEAYGSIYQALFRFRCDAYSVLAAMKDGVDFKPYYYDYLFPIKEYQDKINAQG